MFLEYFAIIWFQNLNIVYYIIAKDDRYVLFIDGAVFLISCFRANSSQLDMNKCLTFNIQC